MKITDDAYSFFMRIFFTRIRGSLLLPECMNIRHVHRVLHLRMRTEAAVCSGLYSRRQISEKREFHEVLFMGIAFNAVQPAMARLSRGDPESRRSNGLVRFISVATNPPFEG